MTHGFPVLLAMVVGAGIAALFHETEGFRTVTSAGARQLSVERAPQQITDARLIDQDGTLFTIDHYKGRPVIVDFIYTRCPTICTTRGGDFARVMRVIASRQGATTDLLSISFDPVDEPAALHLYAERFGAKAPRWRIAMPVDTRERAALLQSFGVIVIPDGMGGFIHDDAVYLLDTRGRLARILDLTTPPKLAAAAMQFATQ